MQSKRTLITVPAGNGLAMLAPAAMQAVSVSGDSRAAVVAAPPSPISVTGIPPQPVLDTQVLAGVQELLGVRSWEI